MTGASTMSDREARAQGETEGPMRQSEDNANPLVRPPIAWGLAVGAGLAAHWLYPLPFVPAIPARWAGVALFAVAFALATWAFAFMRGAGVETHKPTKWIVTGGPYRLTRNPIYSGMLLGLLGLAVAVDTLWLLVTLVPFYFVIRYGVVAREEAYLERKFGGAYLGYKASVRRWI
jgi:protein-S-isoprenylcysteine O-methyltransferase Ste14